MVTVKIIHLQFTLNFNNAAELNSNSNNTAELKTSVENNGDLLGSQIT